MANASTTGFGLKATVRLGNTPSIQGFLQDASFSTTDDGGGGGVDFASGTEALLVGVFNGAFFIDNTTSKPTFANSVAAGQRFGTNPNTNSTNGMAFVNDDPHQEYIIKADAAVAQATKGQCGNVNDFSATDAKNGQSTITLDVGALAEDHMFRVVRSAEDPQNEDLTAAGANVVVAFNSSANLYLK